MKYYIIVSIIVILALLFYTFMQNNIESFSNYLNTNKSYTVNLPINTTTSCQNFCNPKNICSISGGQCSTDIDCYGCQYMGNEYSTDGGSDVPGNNENGKLTNGFTPTYSVLTSDIGTNAKLVNSKNKPVDMYLGHNLWSESANMGMELYDKRYNPSIDTLSFLPSYPESVSLTGEFKENFPPAANSQPL
jgi:hypothetical protein